MLWHIIGTVFAISTQRVLNEFIYRGPGLLTVVRLGSSPSLVSKVSLFLSLPVCRPIELTKIWGGAKSYDGEKVWSSIIHSRSLRTCIKLSVYLVTCLTARLCTYHIWEQIIRDNWNNFILIIFYLLDSFYFIFVGWVVLCPLRSSTEINQMGDTNFNSKFTNSRFS